MNGTSQVTARTGKSEAQPAPGTADGAQDTRALLPRVDVFEDEAGITPCSPTCPTCPACPRTSWNCASTATAC